MWHKLPGPDHDHIDGETMVHHIHLANSVTGARHNIHILLGCPSCPTCGTVFPKDGEQHDPKAAVEAALEILRANHESILAYAEKHGLAIKVGEYHAVAPEGMRLHHAGPHRILVKERKAK